MAHAHHFLSRLDRVGPAEVELALGLYNDPGALRFVLERVGVPDGAPRVALALTGAPEPPWILVTREGRFVTCLGAGMRHDLPPVPRATLDRLLDDHGELRARLAKARTLDDGDAYRRILGQLKKGPDLSREAVDELASVAPLLVRELALWQAERAPKIEAARDALVPLVRKGITPRGPARAALDAHFGRAWAVAHIGVVTSTSMVPLVARLDRADAALAAYTLSRSVFDVGTVAFAARAMFIAARVGPIVLPRIEQAIERPGTVTEMLHGVLAAGAIAQRYPAERPAIERLLAQRPASGLAASEDATETREYFGRLALGDVDRARAILGAAGATRLVGLGARRLPEGHPERFAAVNDVPPEIALPMALRDARDALFDARALAEVAAGVAWLARARAEDLYLPAGTLAWVRSPYAVEDGVRLMAPSTLVHQASVEHLLPPAGPSRGGPCPCGSGKKYKRCCAGR